MVISNDNNNSSSSSSIHSLLIACVCVCAEPNMGIVIGASVASLAVLLLFLLCVCTIIVCLWRARKRKIKGIMNLFVLFVVKGSCSGNRGSFIVVVIMCTLIAVFNNTFTQNLDMALLIQLACHISVVAEAFL